MNKSIKMMALCGLLLGSVSTKPFGFEDMVWGGFCFTAGASATFLYIAYEFSYNKEVQQNFLTFLAKEDPEAFAQLVAAASIAAAQEKIAGK